MRAEQLERIHEAALTVLAGTGVMVQEDESREVLAAHGCPMDGQRVRIPARLVERAIESAPSNFSIEGRDPSRAVRVGEEGRLVVTNGSGAALMADGRGVRPLTLDDVATCVKLAHLASSVDLVAYLLAPWRGSDSAGYRRSVCETLLLTDKPIEFPLAEPEHLGAALRMAEIVWGGAWFERPRLFVVLNSVSPLVFPTHFCRTARTLAALAQPLCVTPCAMGGTTGPATVAGLLTLQHAETLAALVLVQLVRPGAPFLYGGLSSTSLMSTGDLMLGAPQFWSIAAATARLGRAIGLPVRAGGGLTDAHVTDMQAGLETAMGLASAIAAGSHFILHGCGLLGSVATFSLPKFVIDDEIVGMLRERPWELEVDEDTLAVDVIAAVGPGGCFLSQRHTRRHARDYRVPRLFNRRPNDIWLQAGGDLESDATARVAELLESYSPPAGDALVDAQLRRYALQT